MYTKSHHPLPNSCSRNRIKEREKEDALYEGKEKFVTAAYKRKLEADRKYLDEVRRKEMEKHSSKGAFLSNMLNMRANEEPAQPKETPQVTPAPPKEEESDDMDGFILAPPEEQIKGNVEESSDDAGFIMAPKDSHSRSRSRSRSLHHSHHRHSHHRKHHHHSPLCFNKHPNYSFVASVEKNLARVSVMHSLFSTSRIQLLRKKDHVLK